MNFSLSLSLSLSNLRFTHTNTYPPNEQGFLMMAGKGKVPVIHVVVCGLTSSSFQGLSGQGAGKSVLCNRFIRPNHDELRLEHNSVLNLSEFGSNVINNTHFLYWGEKSAGMDDGQTVKFQVREREGWGRETGREGGRE